MPLAHTLEALVLGKDASFINRTVNQHQQCGKIVSDGCAVRYADFGVNITLYDKVRVESLGQTVNETRIVTFE